MSQTVIRVEHLSKRYELGVIGRTTLQRDFARWWARMRGQPDPTLKIGQEALAARYGESILALDDVSFEVKQGEALGIIGRNGAGKSTLLKILSRVTAPTSGVVKVKGRIGSLLEVGTGFHPELTGRENVYLNGAILGMTRAEIDRKFDEIVDFSGVEQFIDTPVKRYSSGMHVRLGFAVAAHLDPEILIVDEVLAVGDAEFQKKCLGKMGDASGEGRTVLFVSHNMGSIQELCKYGFLLDNGKIIEKGDINKVIDKYLLNINESEMSEGKISFIRPGTMKDAWINQIEILTDDNRPRIRFSIFEKIKIRVLVKIETPPIPQLVLSVGFFSTKLHSLIINIYSEPIDIFEKGEYEGIFIIDEKFNTHLYTLFVTAISRNIHIDRKHNILNIEITDVIKGNSIPYRYQNAGIFLRKFSPQLKKISKK